MFITLGFRTSFYNKQMHKLPHGIEVKSLDTQWKGYGLFYNLFKGMMFIIEDKRVLASAGHAAQAIP